MKGFRKNDANINRAGRPKGSMSRQRKFIAGFVIALIGENASELRNEFKKLRTKEKFNVMCKLMPFILPRQTELSGGLNVDFSQMTEAEIDSVISGLTDNILEDDEAR